MLIQNKLYFIRQKRKKVAEDKTLAKRFEEYFDVISVVNY